MYGAAASSVVQSSPENRSHAACFDTPSASPMRVQLTPRRGRSRTRAGPSPGPTLWQVTLSITAPISQAGHAGSIPEQGGTALLYHVS
jgi:hypothetical protein